MWRNVRETRDCMCNRSCWRVNVRRTLVCDFKDPSHTSAERCALDPCLMVLVHGCADHRHLPLDWADDSCDGECAEHVYSCDGTDDPRDSNRCLAGLTSGGSCVPLTSDFLEWKLLVRVQNTHFRHSTQHATDDRRATHKHAVITSIHRCMCYMFTQSDPESTPC